MNYFTRITSTVKNPEKRNAVIMGRKTWESIPDKYRPLPDRMNIVLSRTLKDSPGATVQPDLDSAMKSVSELPLSEQVENVFVIGGSVAYEDAIKSKYCHRIYLTHVLKEFDCDTFFPTFDEEMFKKISNSDVPEEVQEEKGIPYKFCVYERQLPVQNGS